MSLKTKIIFPFLLLAAAFVLSGCGKKSPEPMPSASVQEKSEDNSEKLPEPTGEVDDIVDSALDEMETEDNEVSKEDSEADSFLDDSQETNNFGQSYDENEF